MKHVSYLRIFLALVFTLAVLAMASSAFAQPSVQGQWNTLSQLMPINPVHVALMKNGKILVVSGSGNYPPNLASNLLTAGVWDPASNTFAQQSLTWDMFCNGMVVLPDGRPLIVGGTIQYDPFFGEPRTAVFDPDANAGAGAFVNVQSMAHGRWYPTPTVLGDGRVLIFSGLTETGSTNTTTEIYSATGWTTPVSAGWTPPLYPRMHLLPNGKVFYSGATTTSRLFDPASSTWTTVATTKYSGSRTYGTSVLLPLTPTNSYAPKVLILGGGGPSTNTTELIDLSAPTPAWTFGPNMSQPRIEMSGVMLPNGKVLALGGSLNDEDTATASLNADLYDPVNNVMTSAGANVYPRLYHSVALLLPDASVWVAGGNPTRGTYEQHVEIYKPAYLFDSTGAAAVRPSIGSVTGTISYGTPFTVQTPDAAAISQAVLVRSGSPTHAFDQEQRLVGLSFTTSAGALTVTAPPNGNIAPPGYYMLFLLNTNGVPSVAKFVKLGSGAPPPPPAIAFVQATTGPATIQSLNSSVAVAYGSAQTAGNLNIVVVGWGDNTSSVSSVTDTRGNVYTRAVGPTTNTGIQQSIYYAKNIAAGSNAVTVAFSPAASYPDVRILEYSGLDPASPLDGKAGASGSGTAANSGNAATLSANELVFGAGTTGAIFNAAGSGFVSRMINAYGNIAEDKTVSATGSYNATATTNSSVWVMQVATFRASGQGTIPNPAPTVSTIAPTSGTTAGGTSVTITGTGFLAGAGVTIGGTAATNVVVVSGTSITAKTPSHATGAVNVVVSNSDGQSGTATNAYTYTAPPPPPTVGSVAPVSGPAGGGTSVTVTGTGFLAGASVTFGGTAATNVVVVGPTSITAKTPSHATGVVNVVVTNTDGQSGTATGAYTYTPNPAPTVTAISPATGPAGGGTPVTITGTGFLTGATVTFGGTSATGVTVVSGTSITATAPAHAAGAVNIVVTNTDSLNGTLSNGYTYTAGISFVQAATGPATIQSSNTSVAVAYTSVQTAGDLNVVVVGWGDTTSLVGSVTDTRGNIYTRAIGPTTTTGLQQSIYYAKNIAAGANTVTVTFNKAAAYPDVRILEYSGLDKTSPLDTGAAASGSGTAANSGAVVTTSASELIFGAGTTATAFSSAGSGFVSRMINAYGNIAEDRIVAATGSYSATANNNSSGWVMQVVTFK